MASEKSNKINVIYLTHDGLTDPLGQSQILPYLKGLAGFHRITIISLEKKSVYKSEYGQIQKQVDDSNLAWIPLEYSSSVPILSTFYNLYRMDWAIKKLLRNQTVDIVHCRSYITSILGLRLKRKYNVKFIFDMRGFWPDERVDGGLWSLSNPVYKTVYTLFKKLERNFLEAADHTVVLTNAARDYLKDNTLIQSSVSVIPTCVDLQHFSPARVDAKMANQLRNRLRLHGFVLIYLGSLGTWYMVEEMLQFFNTLKAKIPNAHFLILSKDSLDFKLPEDVILTRATRDEIPLYLSLATASILFIKPSFSKKGSAATKTAEILSMGLPIVSNPGWGDIEWLFDNTGCGVLVEDFKMKSFQKAVQQLITRSFKKNELRQIAYDYFNLSSGIQSYHNIYLSLKPQ